jgi:hypothetical protein
VAVREYGVVVRALENKVAANAAATTTKTQAASSTAAMSRQQALGNRAVGRALARKPDQPEVSVKGGSSRDEITASIRGLRAELLGDPLTPQKYRKIAAAVMEQQKLLFSAAVEPTPQRDYIKGPVHFTPTYNSFLSPAPTPHFFSLFFTSMSDKAWTKSWMALYKLASGPFGILLSVCEAITEEEDTDRAFDAFGAEKPRKSNAQKLRDEEGKALPSQYLEYGVEKPMEWFAEKTGTRAAGVVAKAASRLAFIIDAALTAYEIYEANTDGPSLHAAAFETTARIMGRAFNMSRGINMMRGQGGEFIVHGDATSEVRVARNPLDHTPLPQVEDRRLAYDLVGNRVYEMMMSVLAPKHLVTPEAFIAFRDARMEQSGNIVENAGATIVEKSEKLGGVAMLLSPTGIKLAKVK